jgi:hypothetical protein
MGKVLPLSVLTLEHDGRGYRASIKRVDLTSGQTDVAL